MSKACGIAAGALLLAVAPCVAAETDHAKERADTAYFTYQRNDQVVGGKLANLSLSISPAWPPSDRMQISYGGRRVGVLPDALGAGRRGRPRSPQRLEPCRPHAEVRGVPG